MVDEKYVEWKVKDADYYFKKITDTRWFEYHSGEKAFEFEFLYQKDNEVYLSKIESVMFIKLGPKELTFGETKNKIAKILTNNLHTLFNIIKMPQNFLIKILHELNWSQ